MNTFLAVLKHDKIPLPECELKFNPSRKWRFDYAYPDLKIAIEQEGGAYSGGRHTRGTGFIKDMEKYNSAAIMGWRILRYTPDQMLVEAVRDLKLIFSL